MNKTINVKSEYGKLKKVLLHRPGEETENLTPTTMSELLFEDAYYLKKAQEEHDEFAQVLKNNGVEVVYLEKLAAEVISIDDDIKKQFLTQFIEEGNIKKGTKLFNAIMNFYNQYDDNQELVNKMIAGTRYDELPKSENISLAEIADNELFALKPMPNTIFTRDPFSTIGEGISLHKMTYETRIRETIFAEYIFKYHPEYQGVKKYYDRYNMNHIEGGDVMILTEDTIAVGISQRTEPQAIEELANNIFNDKNSKITNIYAFDIPKGRSWMHLDTVFTQIDKNKFAIFAEYKFDVFKIIKQDEGTMKIEKLQKEIQEVMHDIFHEDIILIKTGKGDPLFAEREQWNDGSNVLAVAPNTVITYNRNFITNEALRKHNVNVIEINSSELSRGRGGPRCMSMPLIREEVE